MEGKNILKIIDVVPIARGIFKNKLSYFTSASIEKGNIVSVEVRGRAINALVTDVKIAEDNKTEIKSSTFPLKKIDGVRAKKFLKESYINAAYMTGNYFSANMGDVFFALIPKAILELSEKIKFDDQRINNGIPEKHALQTDEDERYSNYRSLIREEFAKKSSIILILPTSEDAKQAEKNLIKGIEQYTHLVHNGMTIKKQSDVIKSILKETHSVLIIATPQYLSIPRSDISTIIVERESSASYRRDFRPYIDFRKFAEFYAELEKIKIIFGDTLLRVETIWRQKNDEIIELGRLKFRPTGSSNTRIINMLEYKGPNAPKFKILSSEVEKLILDAKNTNENLFLYAGRKGLYPSTICGDCGEISSCNTCNIPIILYPPTGNETENYFLCNKCGERRSARERCKGCSSWKLVTLGIGIDLIFQTVSSIAPDTKIFKIDSNSVKNPKEARALVDKFYASPGAILIGTEMSLFYLNEPIINSAVISFDSLFSIPDFRINEKIMLIILKIKSVTQKSLLIQTRNADKSVLNYASAGNLLDFYKEEIDERKKFDYPPFSHFIKITFSGKKLDAQGATAVLKDTFSDFEIYVFNALTMRGKTLPTIHGLIKIKRELWPNKALLAKLLSLPPQYEVRVDPDNLL